MRYAIADPGRHDGFGAIMRRRIALWCSTGGVPPRRDGRIDEAVLATFGPVQLRRVAGRVAACTSVKGDPEAGLQTALRRLADYAEGYNAAGAPLSAGKPALWFPLAPGRWQAQIGLFGLDDPGHAPTPYSGKVHILVAPAATLAVLPMAGRPRASALADGAAVIRANLEGQGWIPAGAAKLRLHARPGLLPWMGGFEVAIPVTAA